MNIIKGKQDVSWSGCIYGTAGIGKSTLAASAPSPLFIDVEGGLARIDCDKSELVQTYSDFVNAMRFFVTSTEYKTVVIDTIDALENIMTKELCERRKWNNLSDPSYGAGPIALFQDFLDGPTDGKANLPGIIKLITICLQKNKNILFLGHEQIQTFSPPDSVGYDRFMPKLLKRNCSALVSKLDFVLFCQYQVYVRTVKEGMKEKGVARSDGNLGQKEEKRLFRTAETPAWIAKNRFDLDETVAMDATIFDKLV